MKVLIAEDDSHIVAALKTIFEGDGFQVVLAQDGLTALRRFKEDTYDLICLDIMMPGKNGYDVLRDIRQSDKTVPVLFLSAKNEEIDKVLGLELGADDYIQKPFGVRELLARVHALLRRTQTSDKTSIINLSLAGVSFDRKNMCFESEVIPLRLNKKESELLVCLLENKNKIVDREKLARDVWKDRLSPGSRSIDQTVNQVRKKLQPGFKENVLETIHAVGYRLNDK